MTHDFLPDRDPICWTPPEGFPKRMKPLDMFFQLAAEGGRIPHGLEVVTARSSRRPTVADLRSAWSGHKAGRASPVLTIVFYYGRGGGRNASDRERSYDSGGERVSVCGPVSAQPAVHPPPGSESLVAGGRHTVNCFGFDGREGVFRQ